VSTRRSWPPIIEAARQIVLSYSYLITLRQLHYLLVSVAIGGYRNHDDDYGRLSELTAQARRDGTFPDLLDQTRTVHLLDSWTSPKAALADLATWYRRDRTEGQDWCVILGGEKATLLAQLAQWFEDLGIPIVLLRGFGSQSYCDDVAEMVRRDGRPAVLIYAGDFDASGVDILRDFLARCPVFDKVEHIAVTPTQIRPMGLLVNQGKGEDSRADRFRRLHPTWARYADQQVASGAWPQQYSKATRTRPRRLLPNVVQVEAEAIPPQTLQALYQAALDRFWDVSTYEAVLVTEKAERQRLQRAAKRWQPYDEAKGDR
jgi:hypothetical protein